jgi:hypothetical protein
MRGFSLPKIVSVRLKVVSKLQEILGHNGSPNPLAKYLNSDPKLKIGMRGSTQTGVKGNPNKGNVGAPWNENDFDLDLFIISDKLAGINGRKTIPLPEVRDMLANNFPKLFGGLRSGGKGVSVKFYTENQAANKGGMIFYDGSKQ